MNDKKQIFSFLEELLRIKKSQLNYEGCGDQKEMKRFSEVEYAKPSPISYYQFLKSKRQPSKTWSLRCKDLESPASVSHVHLVVCLVLGTSCPGVPQITLLPSAPHTNTAFPGSQEQFSLNSSPHCLLHRIYLPLPRSLVPHCPLSISALGFLAALTGCQVCYPFILVCQRPRRLTQHICSSLHFHTQLQSCLSFEISRFVQEWLPYS